MPKKLAYATGFATEFATASQPRNSELSDTASPHLHATHDKALAVDGMSASNIDDFRAQLQAYDKQAGRQETRSSNSQANSVNSNNSKSSQQSFDPSDEFDQVLQSMIDEIYVYLKDHDRSWVSRFFNRRRGHKSLKDVLKEFSDKKIRSKFGMSDQARRHRMRASSLEYRRRLGECLNRDEPRDSLQRVMLTNRTPQICTITYF